MNKKIVSVAVSVILLIAVIVGGVFWMQSKKQAAVSDVKQSVVQVPITQKEKQPQQQAEQVKPVDEATNWQTYTNAKLGFEIKYPKSWSVEEHFGNSDSVEAGKIINDSYLTFKKTNGYVYFTFGVGNAVNDYLGQPRGIGAVDEQILVGKMNFANAQLNKYFDYYKNDSTTADIWYYTLPKPNSYSSVKISGNDIFIKASLGLSANDPSLVSGKKYDKTTVPNDPDLLEVDKILSTFKSTK